MMQFVQVIQFLFDDSYLFHAVLQFVSIARFYSVLRSVTVYQRPFGYREQFTVAHVESDVDNRPLGTVAEAFTPTDDPLTSIIREVNELCSFMLAVTGL